MFFIENEGQAVARTDYWQSVQAQAGYAHGVASVRDVVFEP